MEKVDPESPSHGDVPGTAAHTIRKADAVPDEVKSTSSPNQGSSSEPPSASSEVPVPRTVITRVDSKPAHGEVPGTDAYEIRKRDAEPDVLERKSDVAGKLFSATWMPIQRTIDKVQICQHLL